MKERLNYLAFQQFMKKEKQQNREDHPRLADYLLNRKRGSLSSSDMDSLDYDNMIDDIESKPLLFE